MPLRGGRCAGTEKNGEKSLKYCELCYRDGAFITPDITLEEMKKVVDEALKEHGWITPLRWLALWQIPTLERWK